MKYKVTHNGITKTYATLLHTAWHLLETARTVREGSLLKLQAAAVFYAFSFEAYLNHVGSKEITFWEDIDRVSYSRKLRIIAKQLNLMIDHGKPPFQIIRELFDLRNVLAHGRTIPIDNSYETDTPPDQASSWNLHDWEKLNLDKVDTYAESVKKAVEVINGARSRPDHEYDLWNQGIRGRLVQTVKNECAISIARPPA
jgi:hypothetical protein